MTEIRKKYKFYGRVQGVGFRYTAKYLAQSLGLTGWVKNDIEWIDSEVIPTELEQSFYVI